MLIRAIPDKWTKGLSFKDCLGLEPFDKFLWSLRTIRSGATAMTERAFLQLITDYLQSSGVASVSAGHFLVSAQGSPNMSVQVATGDAYLLASGGNGYPINSDSVVTVNINTNSSGNPRITSIVLYQDLGASPNSDASNVPQLVAVDGTPGASPNAPTVSQIQTAIGASNPYAILSNVTVASGASSIVSGDITDVRQAVTFAFSLNGWSYLPTTLTYSSTDGHTFVVTTSSDCSGLVQAGDRIWLANQSASQYFIVTAITSSTITLYGGQNYSITNTAISNPYFSHQKAPYGFSTDPSIWTEQVTDTTLRSQSSPTVSTWYNLGSVSLTIPIGKWNVEYFVNATNTSNNTEPSEVYTTLSTANNSQSDVDLTALVSFSSNTVTGNSYIGSNLTRRKLLSLSSKTTYYLNTMADVSSTLIQNLNNSSTLIIKAVCAYL